MNLCRWVAQHVSQRLVFGWFLFVLAVKCRMYSLSPNARLALTRPWMCTHCGEHWICRNDWRLGWGGRNGSGNVLIALFWFCVTSANMAARCCCARHILWLTHTHTRTHPYSKGEYIQLFAALRPKFWRETHKHMLWVGRCDDGFPLSAHKIMSLVRAAVVCCAFYEYACERGRVCVCVCGRADGRFNRIAIDFAPWLLYGSVRVNVCVSA